MSQYDELIKQLPPEARMKSIDFGIGRGEGTEQWHCTMHAHFTCDAGDGHVHIVFSPSPSKVDAELRCLNLGHAWAQFEADAGRSNTIEYASLPLNDGAN